MDWVRHNARKVVVAVIGGTIMLVGLVLFITPAPIGWFIAPLGLVVLATEFMWAHRLLHGVERRVKPARGGIRWARKWVESALSVIGLGTRGGGA